ncbi:hypothetical protein SLS57_003464 [Botryosphaeria dothidea]
MDHGSIDRDCLHEIWLQRKQADDAFDLRDPLEAIPPGKVDYDLNTDLESIKYA